MNIHQQFSDSAHGKNAVCDMIVAAEHAQQTGGTAPSFLRNTHDMITFCDRSRPSVASWGNNGTYVIIYDQEALTKEVFPAYFKHSNFKSFARQLNFYGFRKIKSKDKECCIYHHEYFQINRADLLPHIQRQTNENHSHDNHPRANAKISTTTIVNPDEVNELKDKVNTLTTTVTALTTTVSSLHQEIAGLKSLVASLADVIRAHDEFIRQPQTSQVVHHSTFSTVANCVQAQASFDHNETNEESLKPQAKQTPSPNHGSINKIDLLQNSQSSFSYAAMTQRQDHESHHSKRQKFSSEQTDAYAPIVSHQQFALPPPTTIQNDTAKPEYKDRHDHWANHTSDNYIDHHHQHHPINNDQQAHMNALNTVDHQNSSISATLHNVGECSADQDYGYEDLAWFALFEEDISHQTDDPTAAPQA